MYVNLQRIAICGQRLTDCACQKSVGMLSVLAIEARGLSARRGGIDPQLRLTVQNNVSGECIGKVCRCMVGKG
jgi:hypothetical protein